MTIIITLLITASPSSKDLLILYEKPHILLILPSAADNLKLLKQSKWQNQPTKVGNKNKEKL
jgi:hypothetical protein